MIPRQANRVADDGGGVTERSFRQPLYVPDALRSLTVFSTLLLFILRDYIRSSWFWVTVVGVLFTHLIFFGNAPDRSAFFGVTYMTTLLLTMLVTGGIFSRANHRHSYPILARQVSKPMYVGAALLASWIVGVASYIAAALLVLLRYRLLSQPGASEWFNTGPLLVGLLPVVVSVACMAGLMALISNLVSPFGIRLIVLGVIALGVMVFDPRSFPIENLRPFLEAMPPLLAPLVGAVRFGIDAQPDTVARASLVIVAGYATTLIALVWWMSARRDVVID